MNIFVADWMPLAYLTKNVLLQWAEVCCTH